MTSILHADRFFDPEPGTRLIAREIYESVGDLPLICPHGHVDASIFASDEPFPDPASLIVSSDHYILRMLYSQGIPMETLGLSPRRAIGTVVGVGGFAGAMSGFFFQRIVGAVLDANGNDYRPIFLFAGLACVSALAVIHLLVPRMTPAKFDDLSRL